MKQTVIGGEGTGGPIASALNLQEHQDSSWLNIDHFPDNSLVFENNIAKDKYQKIGNIEDKCQKMGNIKDKSGSNSTKDSEAEDRSQKIDYNINRAEDGPGDEDRVEYRGKISLRIQR